MAASAVTSGVEMYTEHVHPTEAPGGGEEDNPCAHLDMGHSMMSMAFHTGYCENVMFDGWKIRDVGSLIGSMIGIILMALIYEGLKYYREHLYWRNNRCKNDQCSSSSEKQPIHGQARVSMLSKIHALQTCLHVVQIILSYFLMLIFMTYNVWLCLAVVIGAATGYFFFGWRKSATIDAAEHCH